MLFKTAMVTMIIGCTASSQASFPETTFPRRCDAATIPHSLLQRGHGLSGSTVPQDDSENMKGTAHVHLSQIDISKGDNNEEAPACTGVEADERCWYLSEKGEDCHSTCLAHGRAFKFGVPTSKKPIIPQLLNMEKQDKGEGGAFECYKPDEEHFTLVSSCSASDYRDNSGSWKDANCQLACPCGGVKECSWKQPEACQEVFTYKGEEYSGCPSLDSDFPWCSHNEENSDQWSKCEYACVDASVAIGGQSFTSEP